MEDQKAPLDRETWERAIGFLYRLRRNYEESEPCRESEYERIELAYQSIRCFWEIYRLYVVWAQNFIAGREMVLDDDRVYDAIAPLLDRTREDADYVFECVGSALSWNEKRETLFQNGIDIANAVEAMEVGLTPSQQRRVFISMCNTTCSDAWWAKDIQRALEFVEHGQGSAIFEPPKGGRGQPAELFYARYNAVRRVCFLHGQHGNKLHARLEVGDAIGTSEPTLKNWEKRARQTEILDFRLEVAFFAGANQELLSKPPDRLSEEEIEFLESMSADTFKMNDPIELARQILKQTEKETLADLREALAEAARPER